MLYFHNQQLLRGGGNSLRYKHLRHSWSHVLTSLLLLIFMFALGEPSFANPIILKAPNNLTKVPLNSELVFKVSHPIDTTSVLIHTPITEDSTRPEPTLLVIPHSIYVEKPDTVWRDYGIQGELSILNDTLLIFTPTGGGFEYGVDYTVIVHDLSIEILSTTIVIDTVLTNLFKSIPHPPFVAGATVAQNGYVRCNDKITVNLWGPLDTNAFEMDSIFKLYTIDSMVYDPIGMKLDPFMSPKSINITLDNYEQVTVEPSTPFIPGQDYFIEYRISMITGDYENDLSYNFSCVAGSMINVSSISMNEEDTIPIAAQPFCGNGNFAVHYSDSVDLSVPLSMDGFIFNQWLCPQDSTIDGSVDPNLIFSKNCENVGHLTIQAEYYKPPADTIEFVWTDTLNVLGIVCEGYLDSLAPNKYTLPAGHGTIVTAYPILSSNVKFSKIELLDTLISFRQNPVDTTLIDTILTLPVISGHNSNRIYIGSGDILLTGGLNGKPQDYKGQKLEYGKKISESSTGISSKLLLKVDVEDLQAVEECEELGITIYIIQEYQFDFPQVAKIHCKIDELTYMLSDDNEEDGYLITGEVFSGPGPRDVDVELEIDESISDCYEFTRWETDDGQSGSGNPLSIEETLPLEWNHHCSNTIKIWMKPKTYMLRVDMVMEDGKAFPKEYESNDLTYVMNGNAYGEEIRELRDIKEELDEADGQMKIFRVSRYFEYSCNQPFNWCAFSSNGYTKGGWLCSYDDEDNTSIICEPLQGSSGEINNCVHEIMNNNYRIVHEFGRPSFTLDEIHLMRPSFSTEGCCGNSDWAKFSVPSGQSSLDEIYAYPLDVSDNPNTGMRLDINSIDYSYPEQDVDAIPFSTTIDVRKQLHRKTTSILLVFSDKPDLSSLESIDLKDNSMRNYQNNPVRPDMLPLQNYNFVNGQNLIMIDDNTYKLIFYNNELLDDRVYMCHMNQYILSITSNIIRESDGEPLGNPRNFTGITEYPGFRSDIMGYYERSDDDNCPYGGRPDMLILPYMGIFDRQYNIQNAQPEAVLNAGSTSAGSLKFGEWEDVYKWRLKTINQQPYIISSRLKKDSYIAGTFYFWDPNCSSLQGVLSSLATAAATGAIAAIGGPAKIGEVVHASTLTQELRKNLSESVSTAGKNAGDCAFCDDKSRGDFIIATSYLNYWSPQSGITNFLYMTDLFSLKISLAKKNKFSTRNYAGLLETKSYQYSLWYMWYLGDF